MAVWVTKAEKQNEINEYFSSINCMSLRIIEEQQMVRENCKNWEKLSANEQEDKVDEWFTASAKKMYAPTDEIIDVYPVFKLDTGQKIVELQALTEKNEITSSWRDEFSEPFAIETASQMDLRLPGSEGIGDKKVKTKKKHKSSLEKEKISKPKFHTSVSDMVQSINGGFFNSGDAIANNLPDDEVQQPLDLDMEYFQMDSSHDGKIGGLDTYDPMPEAPMDYDLAGFTGKHDDVVGNIMTLPFDMYDLPLSKVDDQQAKNNNSKKSPNLRSQKTEQEKVPAVHQDKYRDFKPTGSGYAFTEDALMACPPKPKSQKKTDITILPVTSTKPKKSHRKKSSGGATAATSQLHPISTLTLDSAILDLGTAAELNRQQRPSPPPFTGGSRKKSDDILVPGLEQEFDNIFPSSQSQEVSPLLTPQAPQLDDETEVHKTGFDFLDNW